MTETKEILKQRGSRYGPFTTHAILSQRLKYIMRNEEKWLALSHAQQESLGMIAHKIGRILNGDPNYTDSWQDIAGYAQLVVNILEGKQ